MLFSQFVLLVPWKFKHFPFISTIFGCENVLFIYHKFNPVHVCQCHLTRAHCKRTLNVTKTVAAGILQSSLHRAHFICFEQSFMPSTHPCSSSHTQFVNCHTFAWYPSTRGNVAAANLFAPVMSLFWVSPFVHHICSSSQCFVPRTQPFQL